MKPNTGLVTIREMKCRDQGWVQPQREGGPRKQLGGDDQDLESLLALGHTTSYQRQLSFIVSPHSSMRRLTELPKGH